MAVCGAVDIGGTKIRLGIVETGGRILAVRLLETRNGPSGAERSLHEMAEGIRLLCKEAGVEYERLAGFCYEKNSKIVIISAFNYHYGHFCRSLFVCAVQFFSALAGCGQDCAAQSFHLGQLCDAVYQI